ncbi:MAG: PP2C family protein-serine/threonine phosphatase [Cellulomonadaceae bacterium]
MSEAFLEATTLDDVVTTLANVAAGGTGAAYSGVALRDPTSGEYRYQGRQHPGTGTPHDWVPFVPSDDCPAAHVIRTRRPLFFANRAELLRCFPHARPVHLGANDPGTGASAIVPLAASGTVFGALTLRWLAPREFSDPEKAVKSALAAYAAHALDRALLLENRQLVAQTLQASLLTDLPDLDGLELGCLYTPSSRSDQVGGDWYDAVRLSGGGAGIVIGDVTGHDVSAAARMGQLRAMLRASLWDTDEAPSASLSQLDRVNAGLDLGITATAVVGRLDRTRSGVSFRWSNAGHLPPVLRRADGTVQLLDARGDLMLGVVPETPRTNHEVSLRRGDTLVLYTDGLIERRGTPLPESIARLAEAVGRVGGAAASDVAPLLLTETTPELDDDVAILVVRVPD